MGESVRRSLMCSFGLILLAFDVCHSEKLLNGQEEFTSENGQVRSLVVSSTGNVFINSGDSIFQFQNNSFLPDNLQFETDTVGEISVFMLFDYKGDENLLRCNHTSCFVHSVSDIAQFQQVKTFDEKLEGSSLGGEHSAQVVFKPCDPDETFRHLYSAISGTRDTERFSERIIYKNSGEFYMYHRNENVSFYIKSQPSLKFEFISSFSDNDFVYFLRNTLADDGTSTAYISQICIEDHKFFRSYMESKLECNGYTILTAALLVKNSTRNILVVSMIGSETKFPGSILCKFSMDVVESYFAREQRECFNGRKGKFPSWIEPPGEACNQNLDYIEISCGYTRENTRIVFDDSLKNSNSHDYVVLSKRTEKMTSLIIVPHGNIFVGYLGTDSGYLEKVLFDSSFGKPITVFRSPVSQDKDQIRSLIISSDGNTLFYIEQSKSRKTSRLYMIRTDVCEVHTDCYGCLTDILSCVWHQEPYNGVQPALPGRCTSRETRENSAVTYEQFCPPVVFDVQPKRGPVNGSTVLTLTGLMDNPALYDKNNKNTGIPVSIRIGSVPCNVSDVTQFPQSLKCITSKVDTPGTFHIALEMHNNISSTIRNTFQKKMSKGQADYQPEYVYIDPELFDTGTVIGSVKLSGNIQVTIKGKNLDLGSSRRVVIGGSECQISTNFDRFNDDEITCCAPKQNKTGNYTLVYEVDFNKVEGPLVTYTPEPVIHNIQPRFSIVSGGMTLTISGKNLEGFGHNCQLTIDDRSSTAMNVSFCQISYTLADTVLLCKTSALDSLNSLPFWTEPSLSYIYGEVKTLGRFPLLIVEDPVMERDTKVIPVSLNDNQTQIYFKGSALANISRNDVRIFVGSTRCIVNEVNEDGILCEMLDLKSITDGLKERVQCTIGYRTYYLGTVAIQVKQDRLTGTSTPVTLDDNYDSVVVACAVIFGLVVIIVVGIGIRKIKTKIHQSRDEPYNVHFRRDSNILTLDGLSESHTSDVIQNRQNDYQERRHLRAAADTTFVKETEPLLPVIDEDTRALFEQKNLIISNECLVLGEIIGQGHFGCVYKGYLTLPNEKAETIVASKTLHRDNPKDLDVNMFLKEALLMKDFHHKNVMELIGICLGVDKLPLVVLPFMRKGDVLSYIRDVNNQPTVKELVVFGVDIANGMHYLSQLKFVHRDLAARNCMIDDNMTVKVADFGLSRDVYEKEYYSSCDKKAQLPVKWMSPESLEFGLFTHKSDVWSFGVVLWELLTRGVNPYPTVDNWDILRYLKEGRRLNKPDFCPDEMYRIMQQCWDWNPDERPLFGDLTIRIPELLRKLERASEKRKQLESSY